jgi:hypothetical protein
MGVLSDQLVELALWVDDGERVDGGAQSAWGPRARPDWPS